MRWLATSAALHLCLLLLGGVLLDRRPKQASLPIEVELVSAAPAPLAPPPSPSPATAAQRTAPRPPVVRETSSPSAPSSPRTAGREARGAGAAVETGRGAGPAGGAPQLDLAMRGAGATPDLRPSFRVLDEPGGDPSRAGASADPRRRRGHGTTVETTKQRLDQMLAEDRADQDLESGRVHPHLYAVRRDAEGMFHPEWSLVEGDRARVGGLGTSTAAFLREFGRNYLSALRQYGEGPERREGEDERRKTDILDGYNRMLRAAEDGADRLGCLICVRLGGGPPSEPTIARSSGRRPFDRQALEAVRKAVRSRQAPAEVKPVRACYLVEAHFFRVPPLPMVGCSFDESKLTASCFYPTKKVLRSGVKLLSIRPLPAAGS